MDGRNRVGRRRRNGGTAGGVARPDDSASGDGGECRVRCTSSTARSAPGRKALGASGSGLRRDCAGNLRDGGGKALGGAARLREEVAQDAATGVGNRKGTYDAGDRMTKLKDLKARFMENPEFREEYVRVDEEYALVEALVRARSAAKLTQAELARRLGTTQSAVARLEGGRVSPSFSILRRYAEATGTRLTVGLVPISRAADRTV